MTKIYMNITAYFYYIINYKLTIRAILLGCLNQGGWTRPCNHVQHAYYYDEKGVQNCSHKTSK